jgi:hypothetical protein
VSFAPDGEIFSCAPGLTGFRSGFCRPQPGKRDGSTGARQEHGRTVLEALDGLEGAERAEPVAEQRQEQERATENGMQEKESRKRKAGNGMQEMEARNEIGRTVARNESGDGPESGKLACSNVLGSSNKSVEAEPWHRSGGGNRKEKTESGLFRCGSARRAGSREASGAVMDAHTAAEPSPNDTQAARVSRERDRQLELNIVGVGGERKLCFRGPRRCSIWSR